MSRQRLLLSAMFVAVVGVVTYTGDADARQRCRQNWRSNGSGWGSGWQQANYNSGYGNNATGTYYGTQNANITGSNMNSGTTSGMVNGQGLQSDGTYSVGKPTYADPSNLSTPTQPGILQQAPNPATINNAPARVNTLPNNNPQVSGRALNTPNNNPSPDADNSAKNLTTSPIPGASPAKAPAPAAATVP